MELSFDHAEAVFLGKITSTQVFHDSREEGSESARVIHEFEVLELFKGNVSYSSFETTYAWGRKEPHFETGDVNLFFMNSSPGFDSCQPRYLEHQVDTQLVLQKLRDWKQGKFNTLSGSWATTVSENSCSIYATYLVDDSSGTVSFSIGHTKASEVSSALSSIWIYSYSPSGDETVNRSGVTLSFDGQQTAVPFANNPMEHGANFYTKFNEVDTLMNAILAEETVSLAASSKIDSPIEIAVLLNGGEDSIRDFAQCSDLTLAFD